MNSPSNPPWLGEDAELDGDGDGGDDDEVRLPRVQRGSRPRPQHLIVTLLGDYWFERGEHLPSAALVGLADEFDVTAASARTALSRLGRRGLMTSSKTGRHTYYGLTARTEEVMRNARERIFSFGLPQDHAWDGSWLMVTFSVPQELRDVRHILRKRLRWLGFAPLYDEVWVSARPVADEVRTTIAQCGIEQAAVFRAEALFSTTDAGPLHHPLSAWDLLALREVYEQFIERFGVVRDRMTAARSARRRRSSSARRSWTPGGASRVSTRSCRMRCSPPTGRATGRTRSSPRSTTGSGHSPRPASPRS